MYPGHSLLIAGAMIGALLLSNGARAQAGGPLTDQKWVCTDKTSSGQGRPDLEFLLQNGALIAQPLGTPRYRVLDNTPYGLVAADYSANLDLGVSGVYIATVMIDRINGNFMSTLNSSGNAPQLRTGHCRVVGASGPLAGAVARE